MKKQLTFLLFLFSITFSGIAQEKFDYNKDFKSILAKTKDSTHNLYYNKLLKRFQADDTTMTSSEVLALMIGFTDKPAYKPYNVLSTERLIYKLNDEGKFREAYDTATILLREYPLSFQALKEMAYTVEKLGIKDSANYYMDLVAKIMGAMLYSGDGLTAETAMFAVGPADGQHLLKAAGIGIGMMGSGSDKAGNFVDILEAVTDDNKRKMYFNIEHAVKKMFDGKSVEEMMKEKGLEEPKKKKKRSKKEK